MQVKHKFFLKFPKLTADTPIVYHLVHDYSLMVNIFRAKVTADDEGVMVLELEGEEERLEAARKYLAQLGVSIDSVDKGICWHADKCVQCGNCISHCPSHALHITDMARRTVAFDEALCVACGRCLSNCPFGACTTPFFF